MQKLVKEKTGKKPFTNINILEFNGLNWIDNCLCNYLVDSIFFSFTSWNSIKKEIFKEKFGGIDPGAPNNPKMGKKFLTTTLITTIIFAVIYYLVKIDLLNLREFYNNVPFKTIYSNNKRSSNRSKN